MAKLSMNRLRDELRILVGRNDQIEIDEVVMRRGAGPGDPGTSTWYTAMSWRLLCWGLEGVVVFEHHVAFRRELLRRLVVRNSKQQERRINALEWLGQNYTLARGSADVVELLTMDEDYPPYASESLVRAASESREYFAVRGDTVSDDPSIHKNIQVDGTLLTWCLRVVNLLTESYRRLDPTDYELPQVEPEVLRQQAARLKVSWERDHVSVAMIALPHEPMSTLTRETTNLGTLIRDGAAPQRKVAAKSLGDYVLVGDMRLVTSSSRPESYIQVPLNPYRDTVSDPQDSHFEDHELIGALTHALKTMCMQHIPGLETMRKGQLDASPETRVAGLVEEIPRVVAGIFRAARADRSLSFVGSGEFVDSDSAMRLTQIVGMSKSSTESKARVAAVREMLEHVRLKRTVRSEDGRSLVTWEGPIIQRLEDTIGVESQVPQRYGLSNRIDLGLWRIAPELWRMQNPSGASASFMLLDERAFELSGRSPHPFNLYWTIIQRAYHAHRSRHEHSKFDDDGAFEPTFSTLYTWSGIEKPSDAKKRRRARERMLGYMQAIRELKLVVAFDEQIFGSANLRVDSNMRLKITLPPHLLTHLPDSAFRSGKNSFRPRPAITSS